MGGFGPLLENMRYHIITDVETIGSTFLIVCLNFETGQVKHFWEADREAFKKLYLKTNVTFVGFNSASFDAPLIEAFINGDDGAQIKEKANEIIRDELQPWQSYKQFDLGQGPSAQWIDLKEPTPGVRLSLKIYEGRMHYKHLQDMPIDHTADITDDPDARQLVLDYCINDVLATTELFRIVKDEIDLRAAMGKAYGLELRSKSGAQVAEAILMKECGIKRGKRDLPASVSYTAPSFIKTDNPELRDLITKIEAHSFTIRQTDGSPEFPEFLKEPLTIGDGTYQFGIGGLHSKHDTKVHYEASEDMLVSDFDVASYYPSLLIAAQLIPKLHGGKGQVFLDTYKDIFTKRIEAKRSGDKSTANSLKLVLNSTFGKLGDQYCSFYSPDLMLAVTLSGQLNLLILIDNLERIDGVRCVSANTDGITLTYPPLQKQAILDVIAANDTFEFEETPYREIAYRDVNSYVAITTDGKAKRRGAFGQAGVMEMGNPTFQICAEAATQYLLDRTPVEDTVRGCTDIRQFVSVRNVTGGGVQHKRVRMVDDWELRVDNGNATNEWYSKAKDKTVKRKSRPHPVEHAYGGKPFGRVARWYRSVEAYQPLTYVTSGNRVPDTEQAHLCLTLPEEFPSDIDFDWYISRAKEMLAGAGVVLPKGE